MKNESAGTTCVFFFFFFFFFFAERLVRGDGIGRRGDQCGRGVVRERAFGENRARVSTSGALLFKRVGAERADAGKMKRRRRRRRRRRSVRVGCRGSGHLKRGGKVKPTRGSCVLGVARLGDLVGVLVATKVQKAMEYLPETTCFACEARWIKTNSISSPVRQLTEQEKEHARALADFPIDGLHFYSETFDLTRSLALEILQDENFRTPSA